MRRIIVGLTLFGALALMALLGVATFADRVVGEVADTHGGIAEVPPKPASDFDLAALDGSGPVRLSASRGKVVVLSFGASWCPSCREEAPRKEAVWRQVENGGDVQFIGIHVWDKESDAKAFAEEFGISYPMALDDSGKVAIAYGLTGVPETFIIDRSGTIVRRSIGPVGTDELRQALVDVTGRSDLFPPAGADSDEGGTAVPGGSTTAADGG